MNRTMRKWAAFILSALLVLSAVSAPAESVRDWNELAYNAYGNGDYGTALYYFQLAADQDDPVALYYLGFFHENGYGVEQSFEKAAEYYRNALDAGYVPDEEDQKHVDDVLGK